MGRGLYKGYSRCPKWFRDYWWNNPERVRVRDTFRDKKKEYRGEGFVENDWQDFPHKRRSPWDWD